MISALRILFIFHWCSWIFWRNFNCSAIVPEEENTSSGSHVTSIRLRNCVSTISSSGKLRSMSLNHYWTNDPSFCLQFEHMTGFTAFWCYYEKLCVLPILLISIFSDISLEDYSRKCWKFRCRHIWTRARLGRFSSELSYLKIVDCIKRLVTCHLLIFKVQLYNQKEYKSRSIGLIRCDSLTGTALNSQRKERMKSAGSIPHPGICLAMAESC